MVAVRDGYIELEIFNSKVVYRFIGESICEIRTISSNYMCEFLTGYLAGSEGWEVLAVEVIRGDCKYIDGKYHGRVRIMVRPWEEREQDAN